ncbi:glutathione S-transferase-like protein [Novosphingobium aromaticivorans DSM 12444]|uniref:Glutathione S-transferase-like protein n=1 Tax=Novosphingobium aromaticivorans (strain ATCC 700278 / DSM 12444 / CCUG 56034 / CIP 105152 / NBRC 16084 / F199) TaxID=279238 RepID=Q2G497_NOVAD|nr:glutathione S-transferase family protein [Novosphingobium aromaticivorans]ABD27326.1 glutathione S-transferase-like protein [Novosphingobium aromaticivorans DSM 12444]SCY67058.1 glutathione S-transferase [Novosphingobium aromaticivorans]
MKLYGALLSPFVRKIAVVATEKGLSFEMARGGPGSTDPEFIACSPLGKIPAIDDGGFQLADSSAIAVYLDARYPEPRLIPEDPQLRGKAVFWDEFADTVLGASGLKILFNRLVGPKLLKTGGDEAIALQGEAELPRWVDWFESVVPGQGWLLGETFSLADIAVASTFRTLAYVGHGVDAGARPGTASWYDRVTARPAWAAVAEQEEVTARRIMAL